MLPLFHKIFVLFLGFIGVVYCVRLTIPKTAINVVAGQSATFVITYTLSSSSNSNLVILWDFVDAHSQNTTAVYTFQNGNEYIMPRYQNRLTASATPGNATITISNMQPQDTGFYKCSVNNVPEDPGLGHIQLTVQVPPSTPHCNIQGNIVTGHAVRLVCLSEQGMPRPTYIWNRVDNGNLKSINVEQQNGVLTISNMSKLEDGYYQCTASNYLGNVTCQLDLHTGGEAGIVVAGIIGAVLLAVIICVVMWIVIAKRKSKKKHLKSSEIKTISPSVGHSAEEEPARQNLVISEPPETREYQDVPENVAAANREVEDPAV